MIMTYLKTTHTRRTLLLPLLVASAGLLCGCPITQTQDTPARHFSERAPASGMTYCIYVPSNYTSETAWPLVITLHGTFPWDVAEFQIREWKALAEKRGFIVVAPKCGSLSTQGILPVSQSWRLSDLAEDAQGILDVLETVSRKYNIKRNRVLLTGFSSGGYPMYYTGLRNPETFHAMVARACNFERAVVDDAELTPQTRRIPTMIFVGKDDPALQGDSWAAYRWLHRHGWNKHSAKRKETDGGHLRRPETAYNYWVNYFGGG
ncbi:MAG: prolyl oligopeptidase family serine peptidase [Planctomycetes bacterium]|nr:prolyl oligopeptidase family serine peptidase [Planctomycetota bacterium]